MLCNNCGKESAGCWSKCPNCGGDAEILAEDSDVICPQCKKETLCIQEVGNWD